MNSPDFPSLFQINTRVWMTELALRKGQPVTLDDIPDDELDHLAGLGFDWIWLLSVWQTGSKARQVSQTNPEWRKEFLETLPDLKEEDIAGSGFAITGYVTHQSLGGDDALQRIRQRLKKRGLKLMLDFVPNHMALDHPWVDQHPEYFIHGNADDLLKAPQNYVRIKGEIFAYGRDPYFSGWPDTVQLDYSNPALQAAMAGELLKISGQCDGVRCDMAMLILPEVFERTWHKRPASFWPEIAEKVRQQNPGFIFMAEVYWDLEWRMQHEGFDYAYDKRLYDRLHEGNAVAVRDHFRAGMDYQTKLARFMENHDEPRAATAFPTAKHEAAATITFLSPGLRFFHQGEFEGKKKRISPHLVRGPQEPLDIEINQFYKRLLEILKRPVFRTGTWQLLNCASAWDGDRSNESYIAFAWTGPEKFIVAVNYSATPAQTYIQLPFTDLGQDSWRLEDLLGTASFERRGEDLRVKGHYLDEPGWQAYVFLMTRI